MKAYLDLLRDVRDHGTDKPQRARVKGRETTVRSLFGAMIRHDLREGFPLLTTKKVPLRAVAGELLWFLSGSTNAAVLRDKFGLHIWDEWEDPKTGELGPIYGKQWRHWEGSGEVIDQIAQLQHDIRAVIRDPQASVGRRLILTAWNPIDIRRANGPMACHTMAQFNVTEGRLSCMLFQRSADMFLGVPFNIASYALLTHLLAKITGLGVGEYVHAFGDAHIYDNQFDAVEEQLKREPRPLPTLRLEGEFTSLDEVRLEHIHIDGYDPHPAIRGIDVAV